MNSERFTTVGLPSNGTVYFHSCVEERSLEVALCCFNDNMLLRPLTKELQEVAVNELNEVPSRIQTDLDHIREWLSKQPHLKARTDDQWLLGFLRGCKFSLQRTKEKLDLFYTTRNLIPEFYSNRDPLLPEIQEVLRAGAILIFPKTAHPAGPRITLSLANKLDPEKISIVTCLKVMIMMTDILLIEDDNFVVGGVSPILDVKDSSLSYASQLTIDLVKKVIMSLQDAYPVRMKKIHFVNIPSIFVTIYNMMKVFLGEKLRNRITFHTEENLKNFAVSNGIPLSVLPKDSGGEEVSSDEIAAYWKTKVESYRDWFLEDVQYCTDETKRAGKPKTAEDMFGVQGSFIKFEVD